MAPVIGESEYFNSEEGEYSMGTIDEEEYNSENDDE